MQSNIVRSERSWNSTVSGLDPETIHLITELCHCLVPVDLRREQAGMETEFWASSGKSHMAKVELVCTVHDSWICDKIIKMKMEITLLITNDASFDTAALLRTSENTWFRRMFYKRNERCDVSRAVCQNGKFSERRQWCHWFFWSISPKLPPSTWPFPRTFGAMTAERWSGRETSLRWLPGQMCKKQGCGFAR